MRLMRLTRVGVDGCGPYAGAPTEPNAINPLRVLTITPCCEGGGAAKAAIEVGRGQDLLYVAEDFDAVVAEWAAAMSPGSGARSEEAAEKRGRVAAFKEVADRLRETAAQAGTGMELQTILDEIAETLES